MPHPRVSIRYIVGYSDLYGPDGVLEYIYEQLKIRRHLVIVVAEGAGSGVRDLSKLKEGGERDQSGNIKLPVFIGLYRTLACF